MKIDWKSLAATDGYKSLKATYIRAVQDSARCKSPLRKKAEYLRHFNWVISRAKHYAGKTNRSVEDVLNEWEEKRNYCWLNYYQESCRPKIHSNAKKPMGVNGIRAYYRRTYSRYNPHVVRHLVCGFIKRRQRQHSKKTRWEMRRKKQCL
ncbi:MAG: hypothetical protein GY928_32350 [Colwellia sp.]|nr:hypothetical protein [Colwellia sp.]